MLITLWKSLQFLMMHKTWISITIWLKALWTTFFIKLETFIKTTPTVHLDTMRFKNDNNLQFLNRSAYRLLHITIKPIILCFSIWTRKPKWVQKPFFEHRTNSNIIIRTSNGFKCVHLLVIKLKYTILGFKQMPQTKATIFRV